MQMWIQHEFRKSSKKCLEAILFQYFRYFPEKISYIVISNANFETCIVSFLILDLLSIQKRVEDERE